MHLNQSIIVTLQDLSDLAEITSTIDDMKANPFVELAPAIDALHEKIATMCGQYAHLVYAPDDEAA